MIWLQDKERRDHQLHPEDLDAGAHPGAAYPFPDGWVPFEASLTQIKVCKLNFDAQHASPAKIPMFKDLVRVSNCRGENSMTIPMADLPAAPLALVNQ